MVAKTLANALRQWPDSYLLELLGSLHREIERRAAEAEREQRGAHKPAAAKKHERGA